MITENPQRTPASAEMAETWLQRVRQLLSEYNRFVHQLSEALHQTVAQGLPFPDAGWYAECTTLLVSQRVDLLDEICGRAWMPESAGWDPPSTDAPLQTVAESLVDLQQVSSELQRQQDEFLPRYTELATAAARLTSRDEAVMPQLEPLRQQARRLQQVFEQQPWVVAERDVQDELESLQSLFHLLADAQRPLPLMPTARRDGLTIAELEQHFEAVNGRWGRRMALAALRGLIFSAALPGCDPRDAGTQKGGETASELPTGPDPAVMPAKLAVAPAPPGLPAPSNTAAGSSTGNLPVTAVAAPVSAPSVSAVPVATPAVAQPQPATEKPAPATAAELQNLLQNFGRLRVSTVSARGVVPVPVPVAPAPAARGTSTAELAALAGCSSALAARAVALWPAVADPQQHVTASTAEHFRALGWRNLALALDLAGELLAERSRSTASFRSELVELLNLTAEAQNAVRVEAEGRELIGEQDQVFQWMRAICHEQSEGVKIDRFMRRDDRANPEANADVSMRLQTLARKIRDRIRQGRLLRELEGLVENLKRGAAPADIAGDTRRITVDWTQIDQTVRDLLGTGLHENHCGMRDLLLPVVDLIPEPSAGTADHEAESESEPESESVEFSAEFNRVLNSISMHLARSATVVQHEAEVETEDVQYVRERLAGHSIAIVGGVCKPHASARIQKALKLREVRWLSAGKNDRVCQFETDVRGMSLVVLITKLIGHKHNEIREFCRNQGVPWVQTRIQSGYSVNQLARLIREQASEYLDAHSAELAAHAGRERVAC